jgi:uncharacterized membrane protein YuzA (DUF378 family)
MVLMQISVVVWLALAVVGIATVLAIVRLFRAKSTARRLDVGSVSHHWVAEHSIGSGNDVGS